MMTRFERLFKARTEQGKYLCVGLDPDFAQIPQIDAYASRPVDQVVREFMKGVVDATAHVAGAFKPQISYFERLGEGGPRVLRAVVEHIHLVAPEVPIILDYKRADIDRTNAGYVFSAFEYYGVDAVTISPYLGKEAMRPFLELEDKHFFVLCRTSNTGASEFQGFMGSPTRDPVTGMYYANRDEARREGVKGKLFREKEMPLYEFVARRVSRSWNTARNCGLVIGATAPAEMGQIRKIVGDEILFLVPGIGTQGGDLRQSIEAGRSRGWLGQVFNSSSAISFAYKKPGPDGRKFEVNEWKEAARLAAEAANADIAALALVT